MRLTALYLTASLSLIACTHRAPMALTTPAPASLSSSNELTAIRPALSFRRGGFSDRRPDTTKLATFKQGVHTYNLDGERPIQDALFDGLGVLLTTAGHRWVGADSAADVRVDLQLMSIQAARNAGLVRVGATSSLQVKLDFVDERAGRLLYSDVYNGTDERSRAMIGLMGMVSESIDACIVNALNAVGKDAKLAAALQQKGG